MISDTTLTFIQNGKGENEMKQNKHYLKAGELTSMGDGIKEITSDGS